MGNISLAGITAAAAFLLFFSEKMLVHRRHEP